MNRYFLLHGEDIVPCTRDDWASWLEADRGQRQVAVAELGESKVSTVFLGLDHSYDGGPPLIFESMVFGGVYGGDQDRYSTLAEARAGHEAMCERVNLARAAAFAFAGRTEGDES